MRLIKIDISIISCYNKNYAILACILNLNFMIETETEYDVFS